MQNENSRTPLAGSVRPATKLSRKVGEADQLEIIEALIILRHGQSPNVLATELSARWPRSRRYLKRHEFSSMHGATAADIERLQEFARQYGLEVSRTHAGRRSVWLNGSAQQLGAAFGVSLSLFECSTGECLGHTEELSLPSELAGIIEGVFGLDRRPIARPHFRRRAARPDAGTGSNEVGGALTPPQVASLYNFPNDATGDGQCIGLIELGGGYSESDLQAYFQMLQLSLPVITPVSVSGVANSPGVNASSDTEVMLDVEVAGSVAPSAKLAVYFAPNSEKGFIEAVSTAIHDEANRPSIVTISWGEDESYWSAQARTSFDQILQEAGTLGVTICASAGDYGSTDGVSGGQAHVSYPASSPYVLACGGTSQAVSDTELAVEVVWNDLSSGGGATGGGISSVFPQPAYQKGVAALEAMTAVQGRGVPDVAGLADSASAYSVRVNGADSVIGGTSAVAPLWAGLIARINQKLGTPSGYLNPLLYGQLSQASATQDIVTGNNGAFQAGQSWDACTGWGSPNGSALCNALEQAGTTAAPASS
jgi:kumamolisin